MADATDENKAEYTGRCYCGARRFEATESPQAIAYCHCADCRRATGGPVAAFAAFAETAIEFFPDEGRIAGAAGAARRRFCPDCGSPLAARYDYLPGQVYVALGVIDQAETLAPQVHAHENERLPWLLLGDDAPRLNASSRAVLQAATSTGSGEADR